MSKQKKSVELQQVMAVFALLALAVQLFWALSASWSGSDYYDFGWLVPLACAILFWLRWSEWKGEGEKLTSLETGVLAFCLVALIPLRLSESMDPLWRLPLWIHAVVSLSAFHLILILVSGKATSWSCLPATLFCLVAVPLPSLVENPLVDTLTAIVIDSGQSLLLLSGQMVERLGQLLLTKTLPLDIADGCSGIRSFQSSAAAALFLGEVCRGSFWQRVSLLLVSLSLAVGGNVLRIYMLGKIGNEQTAEAVEAAHDPLGFLVLLIVYGGVSVAAWMIHRRRARVVRRRVHAK